MNSFCTYTYQILSISETLYKVVTQRGTANYLCIWGRKCVSLKLLLLNAFIFVVANLCSSVVIPLVQIEHECDNLQVFILLLFRLVLNSGGRTES